MMKPDPLAHSPARARERDMAYASEWYDLIRQIAGNWSRTRDATAHGMMVGCLQMAAQLGKGIGMRVHDFRGLAELTFRNLPPG